MIKVEQYQMVGSWDDPVEENWKTYHKGVSVLAGRLHLRTAYLYERGDTFEFAVGVYTLLDGLKYVATLDGKPVPMYAASVKYRDSTTYTFVTKKELDESMGEK